jgi:hypothetical protein
VQVNARENSLLKFKEGVGKIVLGSAGTSNIKDF